MIDRTYLTISTWIKRHWGAVLFILLLLLIVPPFVDAIARLWNTVTTFVFGPLKAGKAIVDAGNKVVDKLLEKPARKWLIVGPVFLFSPLLGAGLAAWALLDYFKPSATVTVLPPAEEAAPTGTREPTAGGISRAIDEYFA